ASSVIKDATTTLLYISNLTKLSDQLYPTIFAQTWSLAIEEQFYIIWPLLFWIIFSYNISAKSTTVLLIIITLTCLTWKQFLIFNDAQWSRLYYATDTRMDAFIIGGLIAIHHNSLLLKFCNDILFSLLKTSVFLYALLIVIGSPRALEYFHWQQ